jgi:ABC-type nitrate/sulfonate/bicarbonate transport system permease component
MEIFPSPVPEELFQTRRLNGVKVIVGIIFIGIIVTLITFFFDTLERYLLRWRK